MSEHNDQNGTGHFVVVHQVHSILQKLCGRSIAKTHPLNSKGCHVQRIIASVTLLFSLSSFAQIESIIQFKGQNAETVNLAKQVSVVRPEAYEADKTCTRQIPREVYECNDVTRYRTECRDVPSRENCWNESENVCRNVTRYREECSYGPSRRVCVDNPSREVCYDRPSREVCVERPTREVCRTNSRGEQSCQTVGGGQSCHSVDGGQTCTTVGGGQSCHDEQGERTCRDVSYQDQECDTIYHNRCETIPAHEECNEIPYSEEVCGNVTRYDPENYACTETRYRDVTESKKLSGILNVVFVTNGLVNEFPMTVGIASNSVAMNSFSSIAKLNKEPSVLVVVKEKNVKVVSENAKEINVEAKLVVEIIDPKMVAPSFPEGFTSITMDEYSGVLKIDIDGSLSATGSVEAVLSHKPFLASRKTVAELKAQYPSDRAKIEKTSLVLNLSGLVERDLKKKMQLDLKLTAPLNIQGEVLNAKKPKTEEVYEGLKVRLN